MGQYWKLVNLDKKEYVHPHNLGTGLKLWEQLANHPGTGAALVVLCAAMPEARGGGDLDLDKNWHGTERDEAMAKKEIDGGTPGPMPEAYPAIAKRTIGRWAGNRIALIGDYAQDGDLPLTEEDPSPQQIYAACAEEKWTDVSKDVSAVIEHELQGKYTGDGWKVWEASR